MILHNPSPSEFETPRASALRQLLVDTNEAERERRAEADAKIRDLAEQYHAALLVKRPTYPTPDQVRAFEQVAQMIRDDVEYGDHLGHPRKGQERLPGKVDFSSAAGRINVHAGSPYRVSVGGRLWRLTDAEIKAMREHLARLGLTVGKDWAHDDGHAFLVALADLR